MSDEDEKVVLRAEEVLPVDGSEDVSHLLRVASLPGMPDDAEALAEEDDENAEYLPSDATEWVVTVEFEGSPRLNPHQVTEEFDQAWREKYGGLLTYGRDAKTGLWSFAISSDGPKAVTSLKFAWCDVREPEDAEGPEPTAALYAARLAEVQKKVSRFGRARVTANLTPEEAELRTNEHQALKERLDGAVVVKLVAPEGPGFEGRDVWDVMLCLGLEWGDMDCFHWINDTTFGDDFLFSVETTTEPGYFLPEEIAAGTVLVEDLVFVYSIPRSPAPVAVFDAMLGAIDYVKGRLGGEVRDADGETLDVDATRRSIEAIDAELRESGFLPGAPDTLRLF